MSQARSGPFFQNMIRYLDTMRAMRAVEISNQQRERELKVVLEEQARKQQSEEEEKRKRWWREWDRQCEEEQRRRKEEQRRREEEQRRREEEQKRREEEEKAKQRRRRWREWLARRYTEFKCSSCNASARARQKDPRLKERLCSRCYKAGVGKRFCSMCGVGASRDTGIRVRPKLGGRLLCADCNLCMSEECMGVEVVKPRPPEHLEGNTSFPMLFDWDLDELEPEMESHWIKMQENDRLNLIEDQFQSWELEKPWRASWKPLVETEEES